jgi:hypothetical protein
METPRKSPLAIVVPILLIIVALLVWALLKQRAQPAPLPPEASVIAPAAPSPLAIGAMKAHQISSAVPASSANGMGGLRGKLPMTEADRVKALAERDRQMAAFEQSHRAEPVDAAWATKAKSDLDAIVSSEAMQSSGIKPANYSADCRSATCRVAAQFKSSGDAEDWGTFYLASSGKTIRQAKMTVVQGPDGGSEVRIYGTRR